MSRREQGEAKIRTSTKTLAHTPQRTLYELTTTLNTNLRKAVAKYNRLLTTATASEAQIKQARGIVRGCALAMHAAMNAPYPNEGWTLRDIEQKALQDYAQQEEDENE